MYQAGTLSGNPIAVAAGKATLGVLKNSGIYADLEERSAEFEDGVRKAAEKARRADDVQPRRFDVAQSRQIDADVLVGAGRRGARRLRADSGIRERCLQSDASGFAAEVDDFGACLEDAEGHFGCGDRRLRHRGVARGLLFRRRLRHAHGVEELIECRGVGVDRCEELIL